MKRHSGRNPFSPNVRKYSGLTATLTDGERVCTLVVQPAVPTDALLALAALCDEAGLRIVTLSTPGTILGDLLGRTDRRGPRAGGHHVAWPEDAMLAAIGRRDLLWTADA